MCLKIHQSGDLTLKCSEVSSAGCWVLGPSAISSSNPRKTLGLCPPMSHLLIPAGISRLNSVSDPFFSVLSSLCNTPRSFGLHGLGRNCPPSDSSLRFNLQTSALARRAKKGRAPCTWQPFTDASHALRSSFKMVLMIQTRLLSCCFTVQLSLSSLWFPLGGEIDCVDKYGNTPLHIAAKYGHELLISTLMTNGADTARYAPFICGRCDFVTSFLVKHVASRSFFFLKISVLPDVGSMECSPCT